MPSSTGFKKSALAAVALNAATALCQGAAYAQCGGMGWTGAAACVSGYSCVASNSYYSQCLPSTGGGDVTTTATTKPASSTTVPAPTGTPTLYLCGDSTMAKGGGGDGLTDGWGDVLMPYMTLPIVNYAVGGTSARSYTRSGLFSKTLAAAKAGDYVVIEFGHNDGGSLKPTDNGKTDCGGTGAETCQTVFNGKAETVLTYYAYLDNVAKAMVAKGVHVVMSTPTPDNPWDSGSWAYSNSRFDTMTQSVAKDTGSAFVDHGYFLADRFKTLGRTTTDSYYPNGHVHTSSAGAAVVAQTFVKGLLCGSSGLKNYLTSAGKSVPNQSCGGL